MAKDGSRTEDRKRPLQRSWLTTRQPDVASLVKLRSLSARGVPACSLLSTTVFYRCEGL